MRPSSSKYTKARDQRVCLSVSALEKFHIAESAGAAGLSVSAYLRGCALGKTTATVVLPDEAGAFAEIDRLIDAMEIELDRTMSTLEASLWRLGETVPLKERAERSSGGPP